MHLPRHPRAIETAVASHRGGASGVVARSAGKLPTILAQAHTDGASDHRLLSRQELLAREPGLSTDALDGLFVPGESVL